MTAARPGRGGARKLGLLMLFAALVVPVAAVASGAGSYPRVRITVGSELDYPPYALVTPDGEADGFSVDLMKAVCEAMNIEVTFRVGPWSEMREALEVGQIDALPLVSYSFDRDQVFDFSVTHTVGHGVVFKRKESPDIQSGSDLRDKEIIVMRADAGHDWLVRNDISRDLTLTKTVAESLELLASGKHDYALTPRLVGLVTADELGLENIEVTGPPLDAYGRGYAFAVREGDFALLKQLNEGLSIVRATGRYDQIYDKWFGKVDPKGIPRGVLLRYVAFGGGAAATFGTIVILWIVTLRRTVRRQTVALETARDNLEIRVEERTEELRREIAEREQVERQLARAQKMEAVGQLTGGLAHDINNVLAIISMNVELMHKRMGDLPDVDRHFEVVESSIKRAANLTRKLLDYARTEAREVKRVKVNDFIQNMESLIAKSLTPAIKLELSLTSEWMVDIDPVDFETSLLNLALNARDAMPEGGTLVLETADKVVDQGYVSVNPEISTGEFVLISVSDTGIGMTQEAIEKAFEPFFTTKDVGKGTGLGLSMVYGFIHRSGGHVRIYSEPGRGTTVRLYLPRGGAVHDVAQLVETTDPPCGDETVLVVDDEHHLADAAVSILRSLGYQAVVATSAKRALEVLKAGPGIDLLFTDVIMPGQMDGYRLALEAKKVQPGLKVLLTSGFSRRHEEYVYGDQIVVTELTKALLPKPYSTVELAGAVRSVLDTTDAHSRSEGSSPNS